jgi:hypothetical protein
MKMLILFIKKTGSVLIAISAIITVTILYKKELIDDKMMLALVSGVIAGYFGMLKQKLEQDTMFRSLFDSFNARYCAETNDLLEGLRRGEV